MNIKEMQKIKDENYAKSLGYSVNVNEDISDELEYEMTHLFDYKKKTKDYLKSMY